MHTQSFVSQAFNGIGFIFGRYAYLLVSLIGLLLAGSLTYTGYGHYTQYLSRCAHFAYMNAEKVLESKIHDDSGERTTVHPSQKVFTSREQVWESAIAEFTSVFDTYPGTAFGQYAAIRASQGLIFLGKREKARELYQRVLSRIAAGQFRDYVSVNHAVMQLDSIDGAVQKAGVATLQSIGDTSHHVAKDLALYRVGQYFWNKKDFTTARSYFKRLLEECESSEHPSRWVREAQEKLSLISVQG